MEANKIESPFLKHFQNVIAIKTTHRTPIFNMTSTRCMNNDYLM